MQIRKFNEKDAKEVSSLICRNFLEINIKDYPLTEMENLVKIYTPQKILDISSYAHMYVVTDNDTIIGTGAISSFWGSLTESILLTIFVLPEYHHKGIGKKIIETLENDDFFLRAKRIEIPASITAAPFYEKMGYSFKNNVKQLDNEGTYRMEKYRML